MPEPTSIFSGIDRDVYLVLDDFGRMGCAWREQTLKTAISKLSSKICGKASTVRVIGFNVSEGWVRDVSEAVARRLRERCAEEVRELPDSLQQYVEQAAET